MTQLDPQELSGPQYDNLPVTLEEAIERIRNTETVLDDLVSSVEVALVMNQPQLTEQFMNNARDLLKNKIVEVHNDEEKAPIKIVRVVDDLEDKDKSNVEVS